MTKVTTIVPRRFAPSRWIILLASLLINNAIINQSSMCALGWLPVQDDVHSESSFDEDGNYLYDSSQESHKGSLRVGDIHQDDSGNGDDDEDAIDSALSSFSTIAAQKKKDKREYDDEHDEHGGDEEQGETVQQYRARKHITFNYETESISEELCKYTDEKLCATMDKTFHTNAIKVQKAARVNDGKIKSLVVMVRWKDEPKSPLPSREDMHELWNGEGKSPDTSMPIPTGSVKQYIKLNSYDKLHIDADVVDWITTNGTEEYYARLPYINHDEPDMRGAWQYVMEQLDANKFDFSPYDVDGDGYLDSVAFMHSGYGAENGADRCPEEHVEGTVGRTKPRITSHATPGEPHKEWVSKDGTYRMGNYGINTAYRGSCTQKLARIAIIAHEFLHTFGLPDMYGHCGVKSGLGAYDLMAKANGVTGRPAYPAHLSPYSKYMLGWSDPIEITEDGTYTARPSIFYDDNYIIRIGYQEGEYLMLETRVPAEWETFLWNSGVLIYHIDESRRKDGHHRGWTSADRGFPNLPFAEWPSSGEHYKLALLAADGDYGLEKCRNHGDSNDFFHSPDQELGPGNGELIATDAGTYPNTDSYAHGNIVVTGIKISNFRQLGSGAFSFDVTGINDLKASIGGGEDAGEDAPSQTPTSSPVTAYPTRFPTASPTWRPTSEPTVSPTDSPTKHPTSQPTVQPTSRPTASPTSDPTPAPTPFPTPRPTLRATQSPTRKPTPPPTPDPTPNPTKSPTSAPTQDTTENPTSKPVEQDTDAGDGSGTNDAVSSQCKVVIIKGSSPWWLGMYVAFDSRMAIIDFSGTDVNVSDGRMTAQPSSAWSGVIQNDDNTMILVRESWVSWEQVGFLGFSMSARVEEIKSLHDNPPTCIGLDERLMVR